MNFGSILVFLVLCALCDAWRFKTHWKQLQKSAAVGLLTMAPFLHGNPAQAARDVASISTSGIIFKDTLKVSAFEDPKVSGVSLYISDFERPLTEKLAKDFFNDPSSSSLTCVRTGPMTFKSDISTSSEGEEVFEESRNLFFKQIRVRRIIDKDTKTLVYVAYNTRLDKGSDENKARFKSSMCAVHID